jgi:hypothetical protein
MKEVEKLITPLIDSQFPGFYQEEGPLFVLFLKEYYKWLSTKTYEIDGINVAGATLYHSRSLPEYRDIDRTVEDYIVYFKEKYLKGVNFNSLSNRRNLIKAAHDIFSSKGSSQSLELLFSLVYGIKIEIYTPGDDIFRCSNGEWTIPKYLEVTPTTKTAGMAGKQITGSRSNATAFVEYVITRNINGKNIDLLFLSSISGGFEVGDIITTDGIVENAPKVFGSFNSINVTEAGEGFSRGEEVTITSSTGVEGKAIVSAVESQTGLVRFTLVDGGWGYSITANSTVSEKVLTYTSLTNSNSEITTFEKFETIEQNNYSLAINNVIGNFSPGDTLTNHSGAVSIIASRTQNTDSNTATLIINPISGSTFANTIVYNTNSPFIATNTAVAFTVSTQLRQRTGSTNTSFGIVTSTSNVVLLTVNTSTIASNGLHVGTYLLQTSSLASGRVLAIPRESNHNYANVNVIVVGNTSGNFTNTDVFNTYSDSDYATYIANGTPTAATNGYFYSLESVSGGARWSSSNTVLSSDVPTVNTTIFLAADLGGKYSSNTNYKSLGLLIGSNSTAVGITNTTNTFYATTSSKTLITGLTSNSVANLVLVSSGTGADFSIGSISDSEVVLLSPDLLSSNNDGPGSNSVPFSTMLISGANSGYGNLSSVGIISGGSGYSNTDKIVFSGGNTGAGSFTAGNASLITDASGTIVIVNLSANVGNLIVSTPSASILDSGGGASAGSGADILPASPYGFIKAPLGDADTPILDLLRFESKTIGTISSLTGINPGENYNIAPFVFLEEAGVAAYGKRDIILEINTLSKNIGFTTGETIEQTINSPSISITSNTYSGNTSNTYDVGEYITTNNGITVTGSGFVYSTTKDALTNTYTTVLTGNTGVFTNTITTSKLTVSTNTGFTVGATATQGAVNGEILASNSTTLIIKSASGSFVVSGAKVTSTGTANATVTAADNAYKVFQLNGATTRSVTDILSTAADTSAAVAKGKIKSGSNTSVLKVKRTSLFTDFTPGGTIVGKTSGETALVTVDLIDSSTAVIGRNANVTANVVASLGSVTTLSITDSGVYYLQDQTAIFSSIDGERIGRGKINIGGTGTGSGYYSAARGLLDDADYIHDGEYYQEFSYEVQSSKPLSVYSDLLKQVLHVAGTKLFGKVVTSSTANVELNVVQSTVTIT